MFLQFHVLTNYPGSLLNRDDVGLAKRIPFGGTSRIRISSQCLKRHWRTYQGEGSLNSIEGVPMSIRSRRTFEEYVRVPLEKDGIDPEIARALTETIMSVALGESVKKKEAKSAAKKDAETPRERLETNQVCVLGAPEINFFLEDLREISKNVRDVESAQKAVRDRYASRSHVANLRALRLSAGLDAALMGRMVTSDILARFDAAIHVGQAFTVHRELAESDYFSVVDDLFQRGNDPQMGSGHIGTTELTTGLYYQYVAIDVPLLVSNIEGCPRAMWRKADLTLASEVVSRMIRIMATVSPGAKLGSTAPYSYAQFVLVECGTSQPCTYTDAFLEAVPTDAGLLSNTYRALSEHVGSLDSVYGKQTERRFVALRPTDDLHRIATRDEMGIKGLSEWAASRVAT